MLARLRLTRRRPAGQPRGCVRGRADHAGCTGVERRGRACMARGTPAAGRRLRGAGRDATTAPRAAALVALALADPAAARRALAYAIAQRGLPLPNAPTPSAATAWGWTGDARSLTEPTARVLLAVNALTPRDAADAARGRRAAAHAPVRGRRMELRQRLRLRRRPARLRADHGDGAHRAPAGPRRGRRARVRVPRRAAGASSRAG